jgi:hypothetical protein
LGKKDGRRAQISSVGLKLLFEIHPKKGEKPTVLLATVFLDSHQLVFFMNCQPDIVKVFWDSNNMLLEGGSSIILNIT